MGGKELWIKEEERVEDLLYGLLGDCINGYGEDAYGQFDYFVEQFLKDGKPINVNGVDTYDLTSDQFDADWYRERVNFLADEYQTEMNFKYAELS